MATEQEQAYADRFLTATPAQFTAAWSAGAGGALAEGWEAGGLSSAVRTAELTRAGVDAYRYEDADPGSLGPYGDIDVMAYAHQRKRLPRVGNDDAKRQVREAGVKVDIGDADLTQPALDIIIDRAREHKRRAEIVQSSGISAAAQLALGFGAGLVDPVNLVAAFLPIAPASMVARIGQATTTAGRVGARAAVGAVEGFGGALLLEPLTALARTQEGRDYTTAHFLQNIAFGAGVGAVLRPVAGGIKDVWDARLSNALPDPTNISSRLDAETYQEALQAEIAHLVDGTELRASEVIDRKAALAPEVSATPRPKAERRTYTFKDVARAINTAIAVNDGLKAGGGKGSGGSTSFDVLLSDYLPGLSRNKLQPFLDRLIEERGLVVQGGKIKRGKLSAAERAKKSAKQLHTRINIIRHRIAEQFPNIGRNNTFYLDQLNQHFDDVQIGRKPFIKYVNDLIDKGEAKLISEGTPDTGKKLRLGDQHFDDIDKKSSTLIQFASGPDPLPARQPDLSVTVDVPSRELPVVEALKEPESLARRVKLSAAIKRDGPAIENTVARQEWWVGRLQKRALRKKKTETEKAEDAHTTYMFEQAGVKPRTVHTIAARKIAEHEREVVAAERVTADLESEDAFLKQLIGEDVREDQLSPEALGELKADRAAINEQLTAEVRDIDAMTACIVGD